LTKVLAHLPLFSNKVLILNHNSLVFSGVGFTFLNPLMKLKPDFANEFARSRARFMTKMSSQKPHYFGIIKLSSIGSVTKDQGLAEVG